MPFVSPETVRAVIAAYERKPAIVSPRYRGKRGHPVALPLSLRDEIRTASPGATLHDVIHAHSDMRVDVDVEDRGVVRDVDRKEDLAATSESVREDASLIVEIEGKKQGLEAGDPRLTALSREAERLAGEVQQKSRVERELAESVNGDDEAQTRSN